MKVILRTAKQNGVKSLAIPSIGVGKPQYPPKLSANILFEEVLAFHTQNPGVDMKFHFVILDKKVYQEFSEEYAEKTSNILPQTRVSFTIVIFVQASVIPCTPDLKMDAGWS